MSSMTDRSTLDRWLEGTGPEHPIRREIRFGGMDDYLDELERLLTTLERAAPTRLGGKRRDFRGLTETERWQDLLSELLVARWSVCQGVGFEFGGLGTAQPDLVLSEYDFGIEVTRRSRNGAVALRRSLYRGLANVTPRPQPVVTLNAQPLAIWEGILAQINDEALATLRSGGRHLQAVVRPARDGHPAATADIDLFAGPSAYPTIRYSSPATTLAVTMLDIEDLVVACLEDSRKTKQGAAMPCFPRRRWVFAGQCRVASGQGRLGQSTGSSSEAAAHVRGRRADVRLGLGTASVGARDWSKRRRRCSAGDYRVERTDGDGDCRRRTDPLREDDRHAVGVVGRGPGRDRSLPDHLVGSRPNTPMIPR